MPEPAKTETTPIEPLPVTVIGTRTTGGAPITDGQVVQTPDHQPNLIVNVVSPILAIAIRFGNEFCVSFAGALLAGGITEKVLPHADSEALIWGAFILSCSIAGVGALKNAATVFSGLEKKFPLASGSV